MLRILGGILPGFRKPVPCEIKSQPPPLEFTRAKGKAWVERDKRRRKQFERHEGDRLALKALYMDQRFPVDWRYYLLKNFPLGALNARNRIKNRCWQSGRSRAVYVEFGLCRIKFREMAKDRMLPGIKEASW